METDHETFIQWCHGKAHKRFLPLFLSSILAGAYIGFASQLFTLITVSSGLSYGISQILGGLIFSVGLIFVVLGKVDLFTGNCLLSYSCYNSISSWIFTLKNWVIVYIGNFIGALLLVGLYHTSGLLTSGQGVIAERAYAIANTKMNLAFVPALSRGILCNWLVCFAVLLCIYSENNLTKLLVIPAPILTFVALGYEHSIANMYFLPAGIIAQRYISVEKLLNWGGIFRNLLPVTLGNIIGGIIFVSLFYWIIQGKSVK
ncbi:MAG: formate/nitrite transporter family protein [Candidatus Atribacteria bacterium]|nr:formate/nitrite transporter family protein [Candidatus Atribacteria bacterium]